MEENIIAWNMTNWFSVVLMAAIGFVAFGLIQKVLAKKLGSGANA